MKIMAFFSAAAALCVLAGVSSAATQSTSAPVKKQRIRIDVIGNPGSGNGTFTLTPLTAGPLKADSGTFGSHDNGQSLIPPITPTVRNGQSVQEIRATAIYTGKRGQFTILERIGLVGVGPELHDGSRYGVFTGTWTLSGDTGVYEGLSGKGPQAGVALPRSGKSVRWSDEGFVQSAG